MGPFLGIRLIARSASTITSRPRLLIMGMLPPLAVTVLYVVLAVIGGPALVHAITGWVGDVTAGSPGWLGSTLSFLLALVVLGAVGVVAAVAFTTLTLALGGPVYDRISESIDREVLGLTGVQDEHLGVAVMRSASQSAVIFALSMGSALLGIVLGLIPAVGTIASLVVGLCLGGWLMTTELLGGAFGRRGKPTLKERWRYMRHQPISTLSFAIPAQFVLSIPVISVLAFPFFSAAATMLAHKLITESPTWPTPDKERHDF
ncbi:EI24 domain-containing protein [Stomatohabitans albus]|uniref:EI24 domain-containing protein n=1 Tax=Stomatohabitans albus TaxID=3110766 RepID=UPI00300C2E5F